MASRWWAQLVILAFLSAQAVITVRASCFGGKFPWRMFAHRDPADRYLMAIAHGAGGETTTIPLEEIFRYQRGSTDLRLPDTFKPVTEDSDRTRRAEFARFLGEWAKAHGIPVVKVELLWIVVDLRTNKVRTRSIVTVPLEAS
jgi:hypothetical protein